MTDRKLTLALILGCLTTAAFAHASPIDGSTDEAYQSNRDLLKSFVKIHESAFETGVLCSSTLISKNILLTARHCVDLLMPGDSIELNDQASFEVVAIEKTAQENSFPKGQPGTSTDLALILFKSNDCANSKLSDISPIPLATDANRADLSNRVLIAGYGISGPNHGDAGTLRAGYNEWSWSDYSKPTADRQKLASSLITRGHLPQNCLMLAGERTDIVGFVNETGKKLSSQGADFSGMNPNPPKDAVALSGDSGSAAIAFDSQQQPYIVGVTSEASDRAVASPRVVFALEPENSSPIFQTTVPPEDPRQRIDLPMVNANRDLLKKLTTDGYLDQNRTVLKNFGVMVRQSRLSFSLYASVLNSENQTFIRQALDKLSAQRDAAGYCQ